MVCLAVSAQQVTTYTTDLNGRRVLDGMYSTVKSGNTTARTEWTQSVNGRMAPLESSEERVISEDAGGRVVERIVRRYDANGNPGTVEKQQIQERKNTDGSVSSVVSIYRGDLNGSYQLAERVTTESTKSGGTTNSVVKLERPGVSGALEVAERQLRMVTEDKTSSSVDVTTYRKDQGGRFAEALRVVSNSNDQDGQRTENTAQYERADDGRLRLAGQTVSRVRKNQDGSESREVDIFRNVPGRADPSAAPRLEERQIIEQRKQEDQLLESVVVQRPSISDPNRLGAPQRLGERVCKGDGCR
ncbi:MAG: hypothetical protein HY235_27975 [Acidobacteria bacterium]|nr:hypothetical protein [Acidobacteriota bacterium]